MMNNLKGVVRFEIDLDKGGAVVIPSTPEPEPIKPEPPQPIQPFTSLFTMEYLGATRLNQPKAGVTSCP